MQLDKLNTPDFNAALHAYADKDGFKYTSVTKWIEKYKPFFDKEKIAQKVAHKNNISVELVLQEWDEKRDNSAIFGTRVHKALEKFNNEGVVEDEACAPVIDQLQLAGSLRRKLDLLQKLALPIYLAQPRSLNAEKN